MEANKDNIYNLLSHQQRDFVGCVKMGVDELDVGKLSTVLNARYGSIHAAQRELGSVHDIQRTFVEFQQQLYAASR